MSGSVNYSNSANGWDVTIYWECEYGDTSAYMYWEVNKNSFNRTFQIVSQSNTSNHYNNNSNVPFGNYLLYVYKNGSYSQQAGPFKIAAPQPTYYTISYNANGGSGTTSSQSVQKGGSFQLRSNGFTPPSTRLYTVTLNGNGGNAGKPTYNSTPNAFYRWREGSTSGTAYNAGEIYYGVYSNLTFYAQWRTRAVLGSTTRAETLINGYTITFNANGGSCSTTSLTQENTTSYTFNGWNSASGGSGTSYNSTSTYYFSGNTTLYAQWTSSTEKGVIDLPNATNSTSTSLTINFDYQGGIGTPSSRNSTKTITKAFKGWGTSASSTTGVTGSYTPDGNRTLYAIWGPATTKYSVINLPTPTRIGYKFMGWATSATANTGVTGTYTPTSDSITTLYAIWKADGSIRLYINDIDKYKIAMVWMYYPTSSTDSKPWKLVIPYIKTSSNWKITAG